MSTIDREAMQWLLREADVRVDTRARAEFDRWYAADLRHQGAYLRARALHKALHPQAGRQSLHAIDEQQATQSTGAPWQWASRRSLLKFAALAASIALAITVPKLYEKGEPQVIATAIGEYRKVPLADRSTASVNGDSEVRIRLTGSMREVELVRGEAWFEVAKDKSRPFVVEAGDARVRAVGTGFSVRRYAGGSEVLVTEGVVEVWSTEGTAPRQRLVAGDRAFLPTRATAIAVSRQPDEIRRKLAWRAGKVIFVSQTLTEAAADFNRYNVRKIIIDPKLGAETLVGQYAIDAPELFARDVGLYLNVPVRISAEHILIGAQARPQ